MKTANRLFFKRFFIAKLLTYILFLPLTEYHNHIHISISFSLYFFLPLLSFVLSLIMLSALVLKFPFKVLSVVADYLGIS